MSHSNCPECGGEGCVLLHLDNGRPVMKCITCPKKPVLALDGEFVWSGPRWLGKRPRPPAMTLREAAQPARKFKARGGRR